MYLARCHCYSYIMLSEPTVTYLTRSGKSTVTVGVTPEVEANEDHMIVEGGKLRSLLCMRGQLVFAEEDLAQTILRIRRTHNRSGDPQKLFVFIYDDDNKIVSKLVL